MLDATPIITDWTATYDAYADELDGFVRSRITGTEAEDVLQDVWSAFATTAAEVVIDQPRAWLYRVARNRITDGYRSRGPALVEINEQLDLADDYPTDATAPDRLGDSIDDALLLLPPKQREVFTRNELDGETLREIATDLGIPLKTAISRKGYARARLRELLRDTYEDYFSAD